MFGSTEMTQQTFEKTKGITGIRQKKQVSILRLLHWAFQRECAGVSFDRYQDDDQRPPGFGMEYPEPAA